MNKVEQIVEEFNNKWPLPKVLALSGGKGVERDQQLHWLRQQLNSLLEEVAVAVENNLTNGTTFPSVEAAKLIRSYKSQ